MRIRTISAVALRRRPLALGLAALFAGSLPISNQAVALPAPPTQHAPSTVVVSNCNDAGAGSLRDAAGAAGDGDVIDLTQLDCSTISLTTGAIVTGQAGLQFIGPGHGRLTIDGAGSPGSSLFYHIGSGLLLLQGMTLSHGSKYRTDNAALGGCVHSQADVELFDTDVHDCTAGSINTFGALGGAVWAGGHAYLILSKVSGNVAIANGNGYASGGAVYANAGVTLSYSTVSDNDVRSYSGTPTFGGGVFTHGSSLIVQSSIVRNHAKRMGGLAVSDRYGSSEYISNSTISENSADYFGGVYSNVALAVVNSTIATNTATHGSDTAYHTLGVGIHIGAATLTAYSSLISNNTAFGEGGYDIAGQTGAVIAGTNNLSALSTLALPADTIRSLALLGPVVDNGGFTPTQALLPGSPGIDGGRQPPAAPLDFDQRGPGFGRWYGTGPDIGAFENQAQQFLTSGFDFGPLAAPTPGSFPSNENFDELTAVIPGLPAGWSNVHSGVGNGWSTIESDIYSRPITAFVNDVDDVSDSSLETAPFPIVENGQLSFVHQFKLEVENDITGYDGVVLEISIDGGAFVDILEAGGSFVGGAYNRTISDCCENPLTQRQAWSGDSDGYHSVLVNLPQSAVGHSARARWRLGTDHSDRFQGYWLDNIHVDGINR